MDNQLTDYLIAHYLGLLSLKENLAQKHHLATLKSENKNNSKHRELILKQWGTQDKEILNLLDNGYEEFKKIAANKILNEHKDKVFINNCPNCGRLARTPLAKQCR